MICCNWIFTFSMKCFAACLPDDNDGLVQERYNSIANSGWNCQPRPSRSQNWMFVHSVIILSRSQQFPTSSSQNQVELGEWATGHFMHCANALELSFSCTKPSISRHPVQMMVWCCFGNIWILTNDDPINEHIKTVLECAKFHCYYLMH